MLLDADIVVVLVAIKNNCITSYLLRVASFLYQNRQQPVDIDKQWKMMENEGGFHFLFRIFVISWLLSIKA